MSLIHVVCILSLANPFQYLSALLMAAPLAKGDVAIEITDELVSAPYVHMTIKLMERFGVKVRNEGDMRFTVQVGRLCGGCSRWVYDACDSITGNSPPPALQAGQTYRSPGQIFTEGDASSASYFLAGAAITGGTVTVKGCGSESVQGDIYFAKVNDFWMSWTLIAWGAPKERTSIHPRPMAVRRLTPHPPPTHDPLLPFRCWR